MFGKRPGRAGIVGGRTVIQRAIAVLRRFGQDAHIYLPGVGMLNGLTAANYLDSAGTTVGTVDQPVGLVLDAAGSLGVELVTNGANLVNTAGWVSRANATLSAVNGNLRMTLPAAGASRAYIPITTVAGKTYRVLLNLVAVNATSPTCHAMAYSGVGSGLLGDTGISNSPKSDITVTFTAVGTTTYIEVGNDGGGAANEFMEWGNISVREVTGIAASQPTTASKPILRRGAVNLLTYSGDFSNAAWGLQLSATKSTNTVTFSANANSSIELSQTISGGTASKTFTVAALVSCASGTVAFRLKNTHATVVDNFSPELVATTTPQMFVFTVTNSAAAGNSAQTFALVNSATSPAIGTLISGGTALFQGTYTAAQIQALGGIPTTTTAPTSTALGPQYWQFDGSNDSLSLGGPLFQMADDHCVVAGALSESATGDRAIFSQRSSAATNPIVCGLDVSSGSPRAIWRDDAGLISILSGTVVSGAIIVSARSVSNARVFRVNAVQKQAATLSLGSTAITSASIGVSPAASPVAYFSGAIYPVIAIKGTVTDPDLLLLEKFVGQLSGVQI